MRKLMQVVKGVAEHPAVAAAAGLWIFTVAMDQLMQRAQAVQVEAARAVAAAGNLAAADHEASAAEPAQPFAEAARDGTPG